MILNEHNNEVRVFVRMADLCNLDKADRQYEVISRKQWE